MVTVHDITALPDPDAYVQAMFRGLELADMPWRMWLGRNEGGGWWATEPEHHLLAIAPPRSHAGKTSSVMIPNVLTHQGPVVTASTKPDVLAATAMARAQLGELWCYCPDGSAELPPGVRELGWSPISGAADWDVAVATAHAMVQTSDTENVRRGDHWRESAVDLLAPVFHWAALSGHSMRDARDVVYMHHLRLEEVGDWLNEHGASTAASMLLSVLHAGPEEKKSIASTAARALRGYRLDAAMRSTENENFDVADFMNGGPFAAGADTIYITASSKHQALVAPLVVGLLSQIESAAYRRHERLTATGRLGGTGSWPILFALDELYGLAPLPDLPHVLSEGGSQGILIAAAVQDLTLIKSRWPNEADSFMTLFGHVLAFPQIRDDATLKRLSTLLGSEDVERTTEQFEREPWRDNPPRGIRSLWADPPMAHEYRDKPKGKTTTTERRARYEPAAVAAGPKGGGVFHFGLWGPDTFWPTAYWRDAPWPHVLTASVWRALSGRVPAWRYWEAYRAADRPIPADVNNFPELPDLSQEQPAIEDTLVGLPVPRLAEWAWGAAGRFGPETAEGYWAQNFLRAVEERVMFLREGPRTASWSIPRVNAGPLTVTHPDARLAQPARRPPARSAAAPQRLTSPPRALRSGTGGSSHHAPHFHDERTAPMDASNLPWSPDDEAAMCAWVGTSDPMPWQWSAAQQRMEAALEAERQRRIRIGDQESVARFNRGRVRWHLEMIRNPEVGNQWITRELVMRTGMWKWMAPPHAASMPAFPRGEPVPDEYVAGPALSAPVPRTFPFEASWTMDDEAAMYAVRQGDSRPPRYAEMCAAMDRAIAEETERRRALGDLESIIRFNLARGRVAMEWERNPAMRAEHIRLIEAVFEGRQEDPGFWKWIAKLNADGIQSFLRGEDPRRVYGPYAEGPDPTLAGAETSTPRPMQVLQSQPSAATTRVPPPECWEPEWTAADTATMERWNGRDPDPACFTRTMAALEDATLREEARRRQLGDDASVERFHRVRMQLTEKMGGARGDGGLGPPARSGTGSRRGSGILDLPLPAARRGDASLPPRRGCWTFRYGYGPGSRGAVSCRVQDGWRAW